MRLGLNRRARIRIFPAHTAPLWNRLNKALVACLVLVTFSMGFTYYYARIRPMVADLARQRSAQMITVAINKVINEEMEANPVGYDELMQIQTGDDGRIQALYANTKEMNKLKSSIAVKVQEEIMRLDKAEITIPFGALLGSQLFSGMGPMIRVQLVPMGYALVDFESSFFDVGINQTKHQIDIVVTASFGMILATGNNNIEVKTSIPVAQTIIVGDVPNSYMSLDGFIKGSGQGTGQ